MARVDDEGGERVDQPFGMEGARVKIGVAAVETEARDDHQNHEAEARHPAQDPDDAQSRTTLKEEPEADADQQKGAVFLDQHQQA